jgi:hypothetical protein
MASITPERVWHVDQEQARQMEALSVRLAQQFTSPSDPGLLQELPVLAAELPTEVRRFVRRFDFDDAAGYCVVRGHRIDQARIGATPAHWRDTAESRAAFPEEILALLYAALVGEPFGFSIEQDGRVVHDLLPVREFEHEQRGIGSKELLTLHTEGAFHPLRADYLLLFCLRNPGQVATMVSEPDFADLEPSAIDILFEPHFPIHTPPQFTDGVLERGTELIPILFGHRDDPYLRIDPYVMDLPEVDDARAAFEAIAISLEKSVENVVLEPGDILVINNHRMVHGRRGFTASYDGGDRWLKRVNITRDIQKSRDRRDGATTRVID